MNETIKRILKEEAKKQQNEYDQYEHALLDQIEEIVKNLVNWGDSIIEELKNG